MSDRSIETDQFAMGMNEILSKVDANVARCLEKPIRKACRYGAKVATWGAPMRTGEYAGGFSSRFQKVSATECFGEIGNRRKPGLVHLLEKGHATIGGGRVRAYPHIAPAADEAFALFEHELDAAVGEALQR